MAQKFSPEDFVALSSLGGCGDTARVKSQATKIFKSLDTDQSGYLDKAELIEMMKTMAGGEMRFAQMAEQFENQFQMQKDAGASEEELAESRKYFDEQMAEGKAELLEGAEHGALEGLEAMDANQDGKVTLDEFLKWAYGMTGVDGNDVGSGSEYDPKDWSALKDRKCDNKEAVKALAEKIFNGLDTDHSDFLDKAKLSVMVLWDQPGYADSVKDLKKEYERLSAASEEELAEAKKKVELQMASLDAESAEFVEEGCKEFFKAINPKEDGKVSRDEFIKFAYMVTGMGDE